MEQQGVPLVSLGKHEHAFIRAMRVIAFLARLPLPQQPQPDIVCVLHLELCRFRFQKNRNSNSLAYFGTL